MHLLANEDSFAKSWLSVFGVFSGEPRMMYTVVSLA